MIRRPLLTTFPTLEKRKRDEKRRERKGNRGNIGISEVLISFSPQAMAE
jgi:hypothetical protein